MSATAGVRYTNESKDINNAGGRYGLAPPNPPVPGSVYGYPDSIDARRLDAQSGARDETAATAH